MEQQHQLIVITGVLMLSMISPGPNFAIVTSTSMTMSRQAGLRVAVGLAAASGTWAFLTVAGLGLIIDRFPWIYDSVRIAGALSLLWLGYKTIVRAKEPLTPMTSDIDAGGRRMLWKAYQISMTNPKALAFYSGVLTVLMPRDPTVPFQTSVVSIAVVTSLAWYCSLAMLFSHASTRRWLGRAKTAIDRVMGTILIGMGSQLLLAR